MNFAYLFRLACVCLASFFLIHLALGLLVSLSTRKAIRAAGRMQPRQAGHFLLALRLLAPALALATVSMIVAPSYLRFEPQGIAEPVGIACLIAALLGLAEWAVPLARGLRAVVAFRMRVAHWQSAAGPVSLAGASAPALLLQETGPVLALAGLFRPRLVVSSCVLDCLSPEELALALRHEEAHRLSHDNLKRLLLVLAPGFWPFFSGLEALERAWIRYAEWAADDSAAVGGPEARVTLADALVRLARLANAVKLPAFATPLLADPCDLTARIERLLSPGAQQRQPGRAISIATAGAIGVAATLATVWIQPAALLPVHAVLEHLVH